MADNIPQKKKVTKKTVETVKTIETLELVDDPEERENPPQEDVESPLDGREIFGDVSFIINI